MTLDEQLSIMRAQLLAFDNIEDKLEWMGVGFDPDPHFTLEARNTIRIELAQQEVDNEKS